MKTIIYLLIFFGAASTSAEFKLPEGPIRFQQIDCELDSTDLRYLEKITSDTLNRLAMNGYIATKMDVENNRKLLGASFTSERILQKCENIKSEDLPVLYSIWDAPEE